MKKQKHKRVKAGYKLEESSYDYDHVHGDCVRRARVRECVHALGYDYDRVLRGEYVRGDDHYGEHVRGDDRRDEHGHGGDDRRDERVQTERFVEKSCALVLDDQALDCGLACGRVSGRVQQNVYI